VQAPQYTPARQRRDSRPFADLSALFDALPDDALRAALGETRHTGRPGYPIPVVWRALVASFYLGIVHDTDLVRALESNPLLAEACGIGSPDAVPSKYAICRFRRKLAGFGDAVADVLSSTVRRLKDTLPGFGETVAVDATDVKAWANSFHQDTDPDAATGAKGKGMQKTYYWYGYKVHLAVDAASELPIWFDVTPANQYDGRMLAPVLSAAKERYDWFSPSYVTADKGYDAGYIFDAVASMGAAPVIDVRKNSIRRGGRETRDCEARAKITPEGIRYRCERLPWDPFCSRFVQCPLLPAFVDSPLNDLPPPYYERHLPFTYGSKEWKAVYNRRVSVERVFSRLKGCRKLNGIRTRRLPKVRLHVALSLLALAGAALHRPANLSRAVV